MNAKEESFRMSSQASHNSYKSKKVRKQPLHSKHTNINQILALPGPGLELNV